MSVVCFFFKKKGSGKTNMIEFAEHVSFDQQHSNRAKRDRQEVYAYLAEKIGTNKREKQQNRFKRVDTTTQCFLIRQGSNQHFVSKNHILEPVLSWCIPDPQNLSSDACVIEFCFVVKEVQDFILKETNGEHAKACKMFGAEEMRKVLEAKNIHAIEIANEMPHEFRSVFEEYDVLALSNEPLADDRITSVVLESVEAYLMKRQEETGKDNDELADNPTFWKVTKKFLSTAWNETKKLAVRVVKHILQSPFWLSIVLRTIQTVRMIICIATGITGGYEYAWQLLEMFYNQLKQEFEHQNKAVFLVLDAVKVVLKCVVGATFIDFSACFTLDGIKTSVGAIGSIAQSFFRLLKDSLGYILSMLGCTWILPCAPRILSNGADVFNKMLALDAKSTAVFQIARSVTQYSPMNFSLLGTVFFLDTLAYLIGPSFKMFTYILHVVPDRVGEHDLKQIKDYLKNRFQKQNAKKLMSYARLFSEALKQFSNVDIILQFINEIYQWITDVIPCLFSYFWRGIKYIWNSITLGISMLTFPDDDSACCMRDVIMSLRKQLAFGEQTRLNQIQINNAFDIARQQKSEQEYKVGAERNAANAAERKAREARELQKSYWERVTDYGKYIVGQGPEELVDSKLQSSVVDNAWNEFLRESDQAIAVNKAATFVGSTHTMEVSKPSMLWVAQCGDTKSKRVFPNPIFVYNDTIHFYVHKANNSDGAVNNWYVAPSYEDILRVYPDAAWTLGNMNFVLLHKVPQPMVKNMFHLETPIFNL